MFSCYYAFPGAILYDTGLPIWTILGRCCKGLQLALGGAFAFQMLQIYFIFNLSINIILIFNLFLVCSSITCHVTSKCPNSSRDASPPPPMISTTHSPRNPTTRPIRPHRRTSKSNLNQSLRKQTSESAQGNPRTLTSSDTLESPPSSA